MRFTAFILITAFCKSVFAYPSGAGSCAEGGDAIGQTGESHVATGKPINTGPLSDGGFSVTLGDSVLAQFQTFTFPINTKTSLTINSSSKQFKGFLIRLGETGTMTDLAFDGNTDSQLKVSPLCTAAGVGGITHTTSDDKTTITAYLNLDAVAADMPLDVTIVVDNDSVESIYYYSRFIVSSIDQAPVDTAPPTAGVTDPVADNIRTPPPNPGYPPCSVCGAGMVISIPDGVVQPPGQNNTSCSIFQFAGSMGYINPVTCPQLVGLATNCGCIPGSMPLSTPALVTSAPSIVVPSTPVSIAPSPPSPNLSASSPAISPFGTAPIVPSATSAPVPATPVVPLTSPPVLLSPPIPMTNPPSSPPVGSPGDSAATNDPSAAPVASPVSPIVAPTAAPSVAPPVVSPRPPPVVPAVAPMKVMEMNGLGMNVMGMNVMGMNDWGMNGVGMNVMGMNDFGMNVMGMNVMGMNVMGMNGVGMNVMGMNGLGMNVMGMNGLGMNIMGMNGLGMNIMGMNGLGMNIMGMNGLGMNVMGMNGLGMNGMGMNDLGMNGMGMNGVGMKGMGIKDLGMNGLGMKGMGMKSGGIGGPVLRGTGINEIEMPVIVKQHMRMPVMRNVGVGLRGIGKHDMGNA